MTKGWWKLHTNRGTEIEEIGEPVRNVLHALVHYSVKFDMSFLTVNELLNVTINLEGMIARSGKVM